MGGEQLTTFDEHRDHLHAVAYRMLGSASDADDAVQETWLRMRRADITAVRNLRGWLTTVVARICLDMLRARAARAEQPLDDLGGSDAPPASGLDPEQEAVLADSVGVALLVVLQTLSPDERLAFVLHDMFDLPFAEIAPIVGRSENTAAQLASRARRRVRGQDAPPAIEFVRQRQLIDAFLAAARNGDFEALLALLHTDAVLHVDAAAGGTATTVRGAQAIAGNAQRFAANARYAEPAVIDGAPGVVVAPAGRLRLVLRFTLADDRIAGIAVDGDPHRLSHLRLALLGR
ncbi:sigma-70 family RNA polymerase sigma factor [Mycobacterium sp. 1164985.4]|uniref:sigma-70 family RNA polymerase sigma factor n=1 Tax=Mycobacterium sp. 1164985.4 TaxID=1834069 RepID=UPI0007FCF9B5|nr:sigma-70 family RNA polymerase sigma factor [Mycobacterium sp. 1164985.4]OBK78168.1 RNA polymerase subunit sigma-70 [Mycobacterium sp. 1164985.4]